MNPSWLTDPFANYGMLYRLLLPVNTVLMIAGFLGSVARATSSRELLGTVIRAAILIALMANFAPLANRAQESVHLIITKEMEADPGSMINRCVDALQLGWDNATQAKDGFFDQIAKMPMMFLEALLIGFVLVIVLLAWIVVFIAWLLQKLILQMGFALSPIFIGFLMIQTLRPIGVKYLLSMTGVLLWPLGWAVASLVADRLFQYATDQSLILEPAPGLQVVYALRNFLATLALAVWILLTTPTAPWAIQKAITTGAQVGSALLVSASNLARRRI